MLLTVLDPNNPNQDFPDAEQSLIEPNGLLAAGGCLSAPRLINAYKHGIFPWYNPEEPILWWSPNPRAILFPEHVYLSKRLAKTLRKQLFEVTFNHAFSDVIENCAAPRGDDTGTWISEDMKRAYINLHKQGVAHSVEAWFNGKLVGGLYGLAIGRVFFGESMFQHKTDASKVAFITLTRWLQKWHYQLIDCQIYSDHLASLGAGEIERKTFISHLQNYCYKPASCDAWKVPE